MVGVTKMWKQKLEKEVYFSTLLKLLKHSKGVLLIFFIFTLRYIFDAIRKVFFLKCHGIYILDNIYDALRYILIFRPTCTVNS